ncbi:hypothetical protein BCR44DRAFT_1462464 [Catenaria anguillulae PL171]|uniref:Uncharacterized protein n=1 Tax=Catenaria anguillulae PL171 TaxID=765915 RepID=A0A1Y2HG20_9FUNG|nr:hypothetical protein BCR44DRAFT_1462464 [Catenaria anguillulae PL171]
MNSANPIPATATSTNWRVHRGPINQYATVDDRFSFPPVPGYTGYVPRNREHFGRSYALTTLAALESFETLCASKSRLPPKVEALNAAGAADVHPTPGRPQPKWLNAAVKVHVPGSLDAVADVTIKRDEAVAQVPTGHRATMLQKRARAMELQEQCAQDHMFLPGYTGFIPRERQRFGEQYQKSATAAMAEFKAMDHNHNIHVDELEKIAKKGPNTLAHEAMAAAKAAAAANAANRSSNLTTTYAQQHQHHTRSAALDRSPFLRPIPGYTGYHRHHAQVVGGVRAMEGVGEQETGHQQSGSNASEGMPKKDLRIPAVVPNGGEHSFGRTSKECIHAFKDLQAKYPHEFAES